MRRGVYSLVLAGLVLCVGGATWWIWHLINIRAAVAKSIPAMIQLPPDQVIFRDHLSAAYMKAGSLLSAKEGLEHAARLYHANGYLNEASLCYEALVGMGVDDPRVFHRHAMILANFGYSESAVEREKRAIALAPDYLPARLRLGDLLLKSGRGEEAGRVYEDVLKDAPDEPYAMLGLARVDFDEKRWEAARRRLEVLVKQTDFRLGYDLIVSVYENLGMAKRAAIVRGQHRASGAFRDPVDPWMDELYDDCFDSYRLGLASGAAQREGQLDRAMTLMERAVSLNANDVSAVFQLGLLCRQRGELSRAKGYFEQCTRMAPQFSDGWAHLSSLLGQLRDPAEAERVLLQGLDNCPESPGLLLMRARGLAASGRKEEAVAMYRRSIRFRSNEVDAFVELAQLLFTLGRVEEGIVEVEKSLVAEPENPKALGLMTYFSILSGDREASRRWLDRVQKQPRVVREEAERLQRAYRERFGGL